MVTPATGTITMEADIPAGLDLDTRVDPLRVSPDTPAGNQAGQGNTVGLWLASLQARRREDRQLPDPTVPLGLAVQELALEQDLPGT